MLAVGTVRVMPSAEIVYPDTLVQGAVPVVDVCHVMVTPCPVPPPYPKVNVMFEAEEEGRRGV